MHSPIPNENAVLHGPFLTLTSYFTAPCVPLFFMVSGALLLPCKDGETAFGYIKKRIGKILGPTLCFSFFYIILNINEIMGEGKTLVLILFSIPFSAQGHGILWFMYTLIGLYLLVPIISPWLRNASKRDIEMYLVLWFVTLLYPYIGLILKVNASDTGLLYYFTGYAGYFLLGYYMSRYSLSLKWLLLVAVFMLPLPGINKILEWNLDFFSAFWYLSAPVTIITTAWFASIKMLVEKKQVKKRFSKLLIMVSNLSFGIYLIHIFIMRTLLWNWSLIQNIDNYYLQTAVLIVLTFIGSLITCLIISKIPYSQYIIGYTARNKK